MQSPTIFLDMDGVLADFDAGMRRWGVTPGYDYMHLPESEWTDAQRINDATARAVMDRENFWNSLPLMEGAKELVAEAQRLVGKNRVFILTATPRLTAYRDRIKGQKRSWALSWLGFSSSSVICTLRALKCQYAAAGRVLVDDMEINCREWAGAGGTAVHYKSYAHAIGALQGLLEPHEARAEAALEAAAHPHSTLGLPTDAAARKATPIATGVLKYFPDALAAVAQVSKLGNDQHNPGQPLHWSKGKSTDHPDCLVRHLLDAGTVDTDGGRHSAKMAWRALALLQIEIEAEAAGLPYADYLTKLTSEDSGDDDA
jgi:hypothetical protein